MWRLYPRKYTEHWMSTNVLPTEEMWDKSRLFTYAQCSALGLEHHNRNMNFMYYFAQISHLNIMQILKWIVWYSFQQKADERMVDDHHSSRLSSQTQGLHFYYKSLIYHSLCLVSTGRWLCWQSAWGTRRWPSFSASARNLWDTPCPWAPTCSSQCRGS